MQTNPTPPPSRMEQFTSYILNEKIGNQPPRGFLNRLGCLLLRFISLGTADIAARGYREYHPLKATELSKTSQQTQETAAKTHSTFGQIYYVAANPAYDAATKFYKDASNEIKEFLPKVFARTNFSVTQQAKENFLTLTQQLSPDSEAHKCLYKINPSNLLSYLDIPSEDLKNLLPYIKQLPNGVSNPSADTTNSLYTLLLKHDIPCKNFIFEVIKNNFTNPSEVTNESKSIAIQSPSASSLLDKDNFKFALLIKALHPDSKMDRQTIASLIAQDAPDLLTLEQKFSQCDFTETSLKQTFPKAFTQKLDGNSHLATNKTEQTQKEQEISDQINTLISQIKSEKSTWESVNDSLQTLIKKFPRTTDSVLAEKKHTIINARSELRSITNLLETYFNIQNSSSELILKHIQENRVSQQVQIRTLIEALDSLANQKDCPQPKLTSTTLKLLRSLLPNSNSTGETSQKATTDPQMKEFSWLFRGILGDLKLLKELKLPSSINIDTLLNRNYQTLQELYTDVKETWESVKSTIVNTSTSTSKTNSYQLPQDQMFQLIIDKSFLETINERMYRLWSQIGTAIDAEKLKAP